jgi:alpha/beta superfamily hydrolase
VESCLPLKISVFTFDFSGSGLSEGEHVSLGYYERDDIKCVVNWLRNTGLVTNICLFGRSMGAASALRYARHDG